MEEVLHGNIRISLSDQDAIRGMERTRATVKRGLKQIEREKAVLKIEGDLSDLDRDLKKAQAKRDKLVGQRADIELGVRKGDTEKLTADIKRAQLAIDSITGKKAEVELKLKGAKEAEAQAKRLEALQSRRIALNDREAVAQQRLDATMRQSALSRQKEVAQLQRDYDKAFTKLQKLNQEYGKFRRAASPAIRQRVEIKEAEALGEMTLLRAKLEALGAKPVEIEVDVDRNKLVEQLAGIKDVGLRLGPFAGTLGTFTRAALVLGPVLVGLLGTVGALTGAIGGGLTGALSIGAAGALGFGAAFGGVYAAIRPMGQHINSIMKASKAYNDQVAKTGKDSDKAQKKLAEFNSVTQHMSKNAREGFKDLGSLRKEWINLTNPSRAAALDTLGTAVHGLSDAMPMLARNTNVASRELSHGLNSWIHGLSGVEGQTVISRIMGNVNESIQPMMSALGHLGAAFGRLGASVTRHFGPLAQDFDHWAESIDHASQNTSRLDHGVDGLIGQFRGLVSFIAASGRVLTAFFGAAMGPGGDALENMTNGLNDLAASMNTVEGQKHLNDFFRESWETTKLLYETLKPLMGLFLEFSTILRPAANAVLFLVAPVADLLHTLAGFGPIRGILTALGAMWLFKRGVASNVIALRDAVRSLVVEFKALRGASAGAATADIARSATAARGTTNAAGFAQVARSAANPAMGGTRQYGAPIGPATAAGRGAAPLTQMTRMGSLATKVGAGLNAMSMGLLGVSAPVAGVGIAAVAAGVGLKKFVDHVNAENRRLDDTRRTIQTARGGAGTQVPVRNITDFRKMIGNDEATRLQRSDPSGMGLTNAFARYRKDAEGAAKSIKDVRNATAEAGLAQRKFADDYGVLRNAQLQTKQAEKDYAAVRDKNSIEGQMALQRLRDARRQEAAASRQWGKDNATSAQWVSRSLVNAERNYRHLIGTPLENVAAQNLEKAKDAAEAFVINSGRAKRGLDAFTGTAAEKLGNFARRWKDIPGVKTFLLKVDDQQAALRISDVADKLKGMGHAHAVSVILKDAKTPEEALKRLISYANDLERKRTARIDADIHDGSHKINVIKDALNFVGRQKPRPKVDANTDPAKRHLDSVKQQLADIDKTEVDAKVKVAIDLAADALNPGGGGGDKHGDGPGVNIKAAVKEVARKKTKGMNVMDLLGGGALGGAAVGGSGLNAFNGIATRFGLSIGSGFRPGSITKSGNLSYHAMGRARDFPGPPAAMMAFARYMVARFGKSLKELIYTPMGFGIKNGHRIASFGPAVDADHYDHVHVAMAQGGKVEPGKYNRPHVLFAEEPGHPEYFISTNPRDRKRSQALVVQAATDVGLAPTTPNPLANRVAAFASGGTRNSIGYAVKGKKATAEQDRVLRAAIAEARAQGAGPKAMKALIMAIMAESVARNLPGGDKDSRGILQIRDQTARGMHINNRSIRESVDAFLNRGFYGKGGAKKLAKNKQLTAAMVAHLVQGNGTGAGVYASQGGNAESAIRSITRNLPASGGGGGKPHVKPTYGRTNTIANQLAIGQGIIDDATASNSPQDIINAITGFDRPMTNAELGAGGMTLQGGDTVHQAGMIELLRSEAKQKRRRRAKITKALRGRLTPDTRTRLLDELGQINGDLASNRAKRRDLKTQRAEARFELGMGGNNLLANNLRTAQAGSTATLSDDITAATAERDYYAARAEWARKRGDTAGQTDAINSLNAANDKIKSLNEQTAQDSLSARSAMADLTPQLDDDVAAAQSAEGYWSEQLALAQQMGDNAGISNAAGQLKSARESMKSLRRQMDLMPLELRSAEAQLTYNLMDDVSAAQGLVDFWQGVYSSSSGQDRIDAAGNLASATSTLRDAQRNAELLPLEANKALAALTESTEDDTAAARALRDYWQTRLDVAKNAGDTQGIIEAAGNLKSLNDEIEGATKSVAEQMVLFSSARADLFKQFGSNYMPSFPTPTAYPAASSTTVNVTNHFTEPPSDPLTWSKGVAWELQATV